MGEHTPGPWSIGYGDADFLVIEAGIDEEVACIEMEDHGACPTAEQSANALLIAAAPDLLAVLESLEWVRLSLDGEHVDYCPWCGDNADDGHSDTCPRQLALAQAKGEN